MNVEIMRGFGRFPSAARRWEACCWVRSSGRADHRAHRGFRNRCPADTPRGPSYLFSPEERKTSKKPAGSLRPDASGPAPERVTRWAFTAAIPATDWRWRRRISSCWIAASPALPCRAAGKALSRPKPVPADFFFREEGAFQTESPLEFPFRRRELTGEEPPERRPLETWTFERSPASRRRPGWRWTRHDAPPGRIRARCMRRLGE